MNAQDVLSLILPNALIAFGIFLLFRRLPKMKLDRRGEEWLSSQGMTPADLGLPAMTRALWYQRVAGVFYILVGILFLLLNLGRVLGFVSDIPGS